MLPLNNPFWSLDQNDLFKGNIWNDSFWNEFGRNLDMGPKVINIISLCLFQDEDDYSSASLGNTKLASFTAPQSVLNDLAKNGSGVDPFAEHKRPTIADRQNEYQKRVRNLLISPARVDPFADGECF